MNSNSNTKKKMMEWMNNDSNTLSGEDIEKWARKVADDDNIPHYLENKNMEKIQQDIVNVCIRENIMEDVLNKLMDYRYVDKTGDVIRGKHVRWIRLSKIPAISHSPLTNGGIVTDIKFLENVTYILVKNVRNQFIQYKYDDCITFQKLSVDELLLLSIQQT